MSFFFFVLCGPYSGSYILKPDKQSVILWLYNSLYLVSVFFYINAILSYTFLSVNSYFSKSFCVYYLEFLM